MHIAVINFQLQNMTQDQFNAVCDELAPAFAAIPGLISKVWLSNAAAGWKVESDYDPDAIGARFNRDRQDYQRAISYFRLLVLERAGQSP